MKSSDQIYLLRKKLNLTQPELANLLGVSFATVNRWENGHCKPSQIALNALNNLMNSKQEFFESIPNPVTQKEQELVTLYHGSRSGINGPIAPISRTRCDFGKGFYMGTEKMQPLTLIASYPEAVLYTLTINLQNLTILNLELDLTWALIIAFNRGKMNSILYRNIYQHYANLTKNVDLIVGYIADDRMFVVLDRFFNSEITDVALIRALSAIKLGKQYVALTQKACNQISILEKSSISDDERDKLIALSKQNRAEGISKAEAICRQYRREGRYFDEILSREEFH